MTEKAANRNDLRWRRTERSLRESLMEQLACMPLDKVKVTELCRSAEVSKAAFYLHYSDVYELADALLDARAEELLQNLGDLTLVFTDKSTFVKRLTGVFTSPEQQEFRRIADENRLGVRFIDVFMRKFDEKLRLNAPPPDDDNAKVILSFVIGGLLIAIQSNADQPVEKTQGTLVALLECLHQPIASAE